MPTAQDDEALQRICEEVEAEMVVHDLVFTNPLAIDSYAKAVARRYAATVACPEWEELRAEIKRNDSGWLFQPHESGEGYRFGENGLYNITVTNGFLRRVLTDPTPPSA